MKCARSQPPWEYAPKWKWNEIKRCLNCSVPNIVTIRLRSFFVLLGQVTLPKCAALRAARKRKRLWKKRFWENLIGCVFIYKEKFNGIRCRMWVCYFTLYLLLHFRSLSLSQNLWFKQRVNRYPKNTGDPMKRFFFIVVVLKVTENTNQQLPTHNDRWRQIFPAKRMTMPMNCL